MKEILARVACWYDENRKPLPWRIEPTPYHVWISEIMLQQTRIEAVIPYYHRFLAELPTVRDLASVEDDRLMKLWEGLGYYSRARNLKKAAGIIVSEHGGELPGTADRLRKLPGIGDYTAGAIASIAFGEPEPAVDGNVLRVISRITASPEDITLPKTKRAVSGILRDVYPRGKDAGLVTEGLMELGELVCLPNGEPHCGECPVKEHCRAYLTGTTGQYPVKSEKKARCIRNLTVFLLRDEERGEKPCYAIRKRGEDGLLAGMWEFPNLPGHLTEEEAVSAAEKMGMRVRNIRSLGSSRHIFTHVEWHMIGFEVTGTTESSRLTYADVHEIRQNYAIPTAFRYFSAKMREV